MKAGFGNVKALYQAGAFAVSLILLTLIFSVRINKFVTYDPHIALRKISSSTQVKTGLHVNSFSSFDVIKNHFVMEAIVWFTYDPSKISLDQIKQFDVVHGALIHKSEPIMRVMGNEHVSQFDVRIEFDTFLDYRLFPIDDHNIRLSLTNHFLPDGAILTSSEEDITIEGDIYLPGWLIRNVMVNTGQAFVDLVKGQQQIGVEYPRVIVSFACERTDPSIVVNMLLTLILILFMCLLTFSTNEDSVLVVSVIIVALIGYRAVMLSIGPAHISYFMLSDYIYLISLSACVFTLLAGIIAHEQDVYIRTKKLFIAGIYLLFIGGCSVMSFIL